MDFETKTEQPIEPKIEVTENTKIESKKSRFTVVLVFVLIVLVSAIGIFGYFLFNKNSSNPSIPIEVVKMGNEKNLADFNAMNSRLPYQISIYASFPKKDLLYLGEGILIEETSVLTTNEVVRDYKSENLVIKQGSNTVEISHLEASPLGTDARLWTLFTKNSSLEGAAKFTQRELKISEEVFLKASRNEINDRKDRIEEIIAFYPVRVTGFGAEKNYYLTNFTSTDFGAPIYDREGNLVGISSGTDSKNNIKIVSGENLMRSLKSSLSTIEVNIKEKVGIGFEFSGLDKFRKEGRPVGLIVKDVKSGSLADISGIKNGDLILSLNNQIIVSEEELDNFFSGLVVEQEIKFEIIREDKKLGITLNLK